MHKWTKSALTLILLGAACGASAQGVKWHPGHYMILNGKDSVSMHLRHIDQIGAERTIKGVLVRIWWHELETSYGRYDFSSIETYLRRLRAQPTPKRLFIRIMDRRFDNSRSYWGIVPGYLRSDPRYGGGIVRTNKGWAARLWEPEVMERLIALYRAIGSRFDADEHFEGFFTEESTLSLPYPYPASYSHEALARQYQRFIDQVKPAMPRSNLFFNVNWIGSSRLMTDLVQAMVPSSTGAGGSDTLPDRMTLGQRVVMGDYGADYRWELPIASGVEASELGGHLGSYYPADLARYAYEHLHVHYMFWARNTWLGDERQRWYTGILPLLRTNPPVRTRCPNAYGICSTGY